jgi:UDP-3-O-[3-hydroxymyristoyl] glucosamine N-acyltransferase
MLISNDVAICANGSIARRSLSNIRIESQTKLDALVQLTHNVKVGKNCEITAGIIIGGSTTIGEST